MARQTFRGGWLSDNIGGSPGDDDIFGYESDDVLSGGMGNDMLDGGTGADVMSGGLGDDTYIVDNTGDVVIEGSEAFSGVDTVISSISYALPANVERLLFKQDPNAVTGDGNDLSNYISGNLYANVLFGRGGDDTMYGYEGRDTISGGSGVDRIYGGADDDRLYGDGDSDTLYGGAGNDELDGGSSADTMYGGQDNDTYYVQNDFDQVVEYGGEGRDTVFATIGSYTLTANVEDLVLQQGGVNGTGNNLANQITGNSVGNVLYGMDGDDTLYGMEGDDTLNGGLGGTDRLYGGIGNDTYIIRDNLDLVFENANEGFDTVVSMGDYALGANVENLTLLTGNFGGGNSLANTITGNNGTNFINGGGGADTMSGQRGDDTYVVDNAGDIVNEFTGEGFDTVISSVSYTIGSNSSIERLEAATYSASTSTASINLVGNAQANTIIGNAGNNLINGGAANDTLTGGAGQDTFFFNTAFGPGLNVDTITDFDSFFDTIQLENDIFPFLLNGGSPRSLSSAEYHIGTQAQDASDRIIYNSQTGAVLYDADGTGSIAAVQFATVGPSLGLVAEDFYIV